MKESLPSFKKENQFLKENKFYNLWNNIMPFITSNKTKLYFEESGKGEPIIFVHEFAADLREWKQQIQWFSREYRCIAFNARGYPPSDVPDDPDEYGYEYAVQDLAQVISGLGIDKAHIVGLSMGAYAALIFGIKQPDMVSSLVLAGIGSGSFPAHKKEFIEATENIAQIFETKGSKIAAELLGNGSARVQLLKKNPLGWIEFIEHLKGHSPIGSANTMKKFQAQRPSLFEHGDDLKNMTIPVLLLVGDEDELCLDVSMFLKRHIKSSGLSVFPQSGHAINLEEPLMFNQEVHAFLSSVERGKWKQRDDNSIITNSSNLGLTSK